MKQLHFILILFLWLCLSCSTDYQYYDETPMIEHGDATEVKYTISSTNDAVPLFYIGKFKDIDGFSDFAKKALRGSIKFFIGPTKDAASIAYIEIEPAFRSSFAVMDFNNIKEKEWGYIGPCIFDKGRQWYNPNGHNMITSDWSPTSTMENVRLTPDAERETQRLLTMLRRGRITHKEDGYFYPDGTKLSKKEVEDAIKWGVLVPVD